MMRAVVLVSLVGFAAAAAPTPLTAKKVTGHVELSAEQKKTMHFGCVSACQPSPIESKCATACEAKMYRCIDETGPNETPEDTKKCQDAVLKVYEETKGIEKKAENKTAGNATKGEKKKDAKKAKMFLQVGDVDDEEEETQDDSEDVETTADDETGDYSAQEDSGEEEAATQEEESATIDEESAGDEEETQASDAAEETSEEETPVEDEEPSDEAAPEEEATPEEPEEESFLQRDVDDTVEAAPAVEETQKVSDDEEAETQKNTDDLESKVSDESSEDESEGDEDEAAPEEAAAPEEEEEAAPVEESLIETGSSWKPDPSTTHIKLYEHPQGSTFVTACPVGEQTNTESCGAFFGDKAAADQCPQITCSKALGVTMKLVCAGGCCPSCWAPDHVIAVDRHTSVDDAQVVDAAAAAPGTCGGVKCFKLACASGFSEGHVNGACCNSCIPGR